MKTAETILLSLRMREPTRLTVPALVSVHNPLAHGGLVPNGGLGPRIQARCISVTSLGEREQGVELVKADKGLVKPTVVLIVGLALALDMETGVGKSIAVGKSICAGKPIVCIVIGREPIVVGKSIVAHVLLCVTHAAWGRGAGVGTWRDSTRLAKS
jgi:hypothetical protein